jgi:ubiquinone/menaquinone biosynthesis C-methylase UbiE
MATTLKSKKLWFSTIGTARLCRGGGNGPEHPSQLYAIDKYVKEGMSLLDYGCGSATTLEALIMARGDRQMDGEVRKVDLALPFKYLGVDVIKENIDWCKKHFPNYADNFEYNPTLHKIDQPDKSFDVVYSRHVVDHMDSFESAMDEHKRVAKQLVIVILWVSLIDADEHDIRNIIGDDKKVYKNEFTNKYSRKQVLKYLSADKEWTLLELTPGVGKNVQGDNTVIVLKRKGEIFK